MQVYSMTSGKGGVGKTSLVCNVAQHFGALGKKVLLIEADLGLANVDNMMGLKPKANLSDLFAGQAGLESLLVSGPENVTVLPASSGVQEMSFLSDEQVVTFMAAVNDLKREFDVVLIDTGAGIGKNVLYFNAAAQDVILVVTPEPTSITDAYALIKVLRAEKSIKNFRLVVNRVQDRKEALKVYGYLTNVTDKFLKDVSLDYLGHVAMDSKVNEAVMRQSLLLESAPDSEAAQCIRELVTTLNLDEPKQAPTGNLQFFWQRLIEQPRAWYDEAGDSGIPTTGIFRRTSSTRGDGEEVCSVGQEGGLSHGPPLAFIC